MTFKKITETCEKDKRKVNFEYLKLSADYITPIRILQAYDPIALLESAYPESGRSRYSIIVLDEAFSLAKKGKDYFKITENETEKLDYHLDFLSLLNEYRQKSPKNDIISFYPVPVGGLGYLGYEYFEEIEDITFRKEYEDNEYDCCFVFGRNFMIFDHYKDEIVLCSVSYEGEILNLSAELEKVQYRINNGLDNDDFFSTNDKPSLFKNIEIFDEEDKDTFKRNVLFLKEEIENGNLIQCVISRSKIIKTDIDTRFFYRELRRENPSPYMFYLKCGGITIFGTSPEIMVKTEGKKITLRPIAGTRKRGKNNGEDNYLENDLLSDPKERAEHLMLVDLARNDLGRISAKGSVKVSEYMSVEKYASVMHIVSNVESEFDDGFDSYSAIKACFPAGTVSGAPKIQAIKTIEKLENVRRGPYAGLVGYFTAGGDFDSCIVIRSAFCKNGFIRLQAGAGIVSDSDPEREYQETENKLASLVKIFNIEKNLNFVSSQKGGN